VFAALDWLPSRLTAAAFAIVGDFENAVYCWRTQAATWPDRALGIVLSSGAGAIGVRLGQPIVVGGKPLDRPPLGLGDPADVGHMDSLVGLVWRALVMWLLVMLLVRPRGGRQLALRERLDLRGADEVVLGDSAHRVCAEVDAAAVVAHAQVRVGGPRGARSTLPRSRRQWSRSNS